MAREETKKAMGAVADLAGGATEVSQVFAWSGSRFELAARSRTGPLKVATLVSKESHTCNMGEIRKLAGHFASGAVKRIWGYLGVGDVTGIPYTGRRWWLRFSCGQFPYLLKIEPPTPPGPLEPLAVEPPPHHEEAGEAKAMDIEEAEGGV